MSSSERDVVERLKSRWAMIPPMSTRVAMAARSLRVMVPSVRKSDADVLARSLNPNKDRGDGDRSEFFRQRSLRFLGDEDRSGDCQVFGQIFATESEVKHPDDDSQWDGSKLTNHETIGPW